MIFTKRATKLENLPIPNIDVDTPSWPIPHRMFINEGMEQLKMAGIGHDPPTIYLSDRGGVYFACSIDAIHRDYPGLSIGLSNGNHWVSPPRFFAGLKFKEYSIPFVHFELLKYKTDSVSNLPSRLQASISVTKLSFKKWPNKVNRLKSKLVTPEQAKKVVLDAADKETIAFGHLKNLMQAINKKEKLTAWELLELFAVATKKQTPVTQMKSVLDFSDSL